MSIQFQVDTAGTLKTGLVSYFKLENVNDSFGSNNLTNNNAVTFVAGKVSNAASFNGTTQYLSLATPLTTNTTNITMACWAHLTSNSQHGAFLHNGATDGTNGYTLGVGATGFDDNGNTLFLLLDGVAYKTSSVSIGTGWHLVGISRGATTWKFWLDGVTVGTTYTTNPIAPSGNFFIGRDYTTATDRSFNDLIDETGFWTKELSAQEWTDLYNGGNGQTMIPDGAISISDTFAGITDSILIGLSLVLSDTFAGITDAIRLFFGWVKQAKNTSIWTNQNKS